MNVINFKLEKSKSLSNIDRQIKITSYLNIKNKKII